MEQSGRQPWNERWRCVAYMLVLVTFWSKASAQIRYSISEELKEGSVVGNIAKDLGMDKVTLKDREYRIVGGSTEPLFRLNPDDGILYVSRKVDREDICERSKACIINLKTVLENPLEIHYVAIEVLDVNDHSPVFPEKEKRLEIFESTLPGAKFQLQPARDPDGAQFTVQQYTLSQNDHFRLEVKERGEDRKLPFLILKKQLDRETSIEHKLLLTAVDGGRPARSGTSMILIEVLDVNDNSPVFTKDVYSAILYENADPGTLVIQVNATDLDEGANGEMVFSLDSSRDNLGLFLSINSENGDILALKIFDFETLKKFQFQVVATDSGSPSLSSNVTVHVFILDQNDNAPIILYPLSSNGSAEGVEEIPRNVNAGHLVTKVRAYDADIGYNGWLLFSLQEVTDHSLFGLDRYTGQIRTLRSFTETDEAEHKLVILVKDNGNVSLSATATVIVKVVEPKEAFAASDVKSATNDEEENNVTFYLMITLGSVSTLFLISIIVLIAMQCSKSTEYTSKYLQETNYDGTLCHSIQYRSGEKRYMLVGPRMSIGSTIVPGSHANTLMLPDRRTHGEVRHV
uniref:protocadherin alpha-3-like n=1 Tax=Gasterosteus aculeatus aculeatus TaxID=481459 RepID=UPI001A99ABC7|nr:protocadherin alpha-3-like [Gasterosteus aculeatus aculeatus]